MRYLRMLTNAVAGGILGAAYLVVLVLQLNPQVPIASVTTMRWFATLMAFYGLYLTAAVYLLILGRDLIASQPLSPGWFSVRLLAWLSSAGAATAAYVTWLNLEGYRDVLGDVAAEHMRQGAQATTIFAAVLVTIAVLRYSFGRRGSGPTAILLLAAMISSIIVPLWLRGPGPVTPPAVTRRPLALPVPAPLPGSSPPRVEGAPRIRMLLLDGASFGFVLQRVAAGQLPNFGRLLDKGATIELATLKPTQAEPVWAAAMTGKYPPKNGVRSDAVYRIKPDDPETVDLLPDYCFAQALLYQRFVRDGYLTSSALHARPLWAILDDFRLPSGIVGLPLTFPAHAERGYVISDHFDEATSSPLRLVDAQAGAPTSAVEIAREVFDAWQAKPAAEVLPGISASELPPAGIDWARWDRAYSETAVSIEPQFAPRVTAVRYQAIDVFSHLYLREAQPELFAQIGSTSRPRSVLDRYYAYIDSEIGEAVGQLAPGDLLLVVSGFGMERETLPKRLLAQLLGRPPRSGTHERAPDGFLIAYGTNVAKGQYSRGAVVDLAPTVLYYMGLPIGRDMDGVARADLFTSPFTLEHAVTYIATHER